MKHFFMAIVLAGLLFSVFAHEYILLANKYRIDKGDSLEIHLFVADGFNIELERPYQKSITKKFALITGEGTTDLSAITAEGTLPVIHFKTDFEGLGLVQMQRDYAGVTLPTDKFLRYLKEDHIENIKLENDPSKKFQKERYTRYIKCLVQSGNIKKDTLFKMVTGHHFEIILLQNPYMLHAGDNLKAQIFFMGKPLPNKLITARNRTGSEPAATFTSRSDAKGICTFQIKRRGDWFIHATHMIPCPDKSAADWESFWASYSFGIE